MPITVPLINGIAYSWSSINVRIAGFEVVGITEINYGDSVAKQDLYGTGKYPVERSEGIYKATVEVGFLPSVVEALVEKSPTGRLQDLGVFDIIVIFLVGDNRRTHKIRNVEFLGNVRKMNKDGIVIKPPMICSHIQWTGGSDNNF